MPGWIQINGKFIPKEKYRGDNTRSQATNILPDIEPFVSPVTGELITSRSRLRVHNKENNVTNSADFSPQYLEKVRKEREREQYQQGRKERIEIMKRMTER